LLAAIRADPRRSAPIRSTSSCGGPELTAALAAFADHSIVVR
jgi:hypothetical protein